MRGLSDLRVRLVLLGLLALLAAAAVGAMLMRGPGAPPGDGETRLTLPSGLDVTFYEMIWNQPGQGLTYRYRFLAPDLSPDQDAESRLADLTYLCSAFALPRVSNIGPQPGQIVISIADRPSPFGEMDAEITQVFEAFEIIDGACELVLF